MIRKILTSQLIPGMYVADFNASWLKHPFAMNCKLMENEADIAQVIQAGIRELFIDTERGLDVGGVRPAVAPAQSADPAVSPAPPAAAQRSTAASPRVAFSEEGQRARLAFSEATKVIRSLMDDVRLGKQIEIARAKPTVEKITASVLRNSSAMMAVRRLRTLDEYTFLHSVSVCGMLASFGKVLNLELNAIHDIALGGLIHDIGKMRLSPALLNKPGKLTDEESRYMRSHVMVGADIVRGLPGIPSLALEVLEQHHERHDGSGYPKGLAGEAVSRAGKMAAIVDVYDAVTSPRVYAQPMSPAKAVQKLFEWARQGLFDPDLTQIFLKSIGIYPVGSLVRLESGRLGVVLAQSDNSLLTPLIRVMYDSRKRCYLAPEELDLSHAGAAERIVGYENPETFQIDISRFIL